MIVFDYCFRAKIPICPTFPVYCLVMGHSKENATFFDDNRFQNSKFNTIRQLRQIAFVLKIPLIDPLIVFYLIAEGTAEKTQMPQSASFQKPMRFSVPASREFYALIMYYLKAILDHSFKAIAVTI